MAEPIIFKNVTDILNLISILKQQWSNSEDWVKELLFDPTTGHTYQRAHLPQDAAIKLSSFRNHALAKALIYLDKSVPSEENTRIAWDKLWIDPVENYYNDLPMIIINEKDATRSITVGFTTLKAKQVDFIRELIPAWLQIVLPNRLLNFMKSNNYPLFKNLDEAGKERLFEISDITVNFALANLLALLPTNPHQNTFLGNSYQSDLCCWQKIYKRELFVFTGLAIYLVAVWRIFMTEHHQQYMSSIASAVPKIKTLCMQLAPGNLLICKEEIQNPEPSSINTNAMFRLIMNACLVGGLGSYIMFCINTLKCLHINQAQLETLSVYKEALIQKDNSYTTYTGENINLLDENSPKLAI